MDPQTLQQLQEWAVKYNDPLFFQEDPISFPRRFLTDGASLQDIEVSAVFAAHFAWGRRTMIVRDATRLFDEMQWHPYDYVMSGEYRRGPQSIHRTVKWDEVASICGRLSSFYSSESTLEALDAASMRTVIYGQKPDPKAPNKKINMLRRWMVRRDGIVDLGLWRSTDPRELVVPLDVHVYTQAVALGLTRRRPKDIVTALEITDAFREIWPDDPLKGDFALFGYGVSGDAATAGGGGD